MNGNEKLFEDEELIWPDVNPAWTPEELLKNKGMFHFRDIKKILGLETGLVTLLRKGLNDDKLYQEYGIKNLWENNTLSG